jgi:hypothetical protein
MAIEHITLTEEQRTALHAIAQQSGKSEHELVQEAVEQLIRQFRQTHRQALLQQACGMWRDRTDLPDFEALRSELDRSTTS